MKIHAKLYKLSKLKCRSTGVTISFFSFHCVHPKLYPFSSTFFFKWHCPKIVEIGGSKEGMPLGSMVEEKGVRERHYRYLIAEAVDEI